MKLIAEIKLLPTTSQEEILQATLETANDVCNYLSARALEAKTFRQFDLHYLAYKDTREAFGIVADLTIRCIAKVADAYKTGSKKTQRVFKPTAAQPYNDKVLRFINDDTLSIWTVNGREKIRWTCGDYQRKLLKNRKGESDLMYRRGRWFLACTCDVQEVTAIDADDFIGVDLGIVNLATDSDNAVYSGESVENNRRKFNHRRRNLQRKRTRAATRKLRQISGKQARYQKDVNHCISKAIVLNAERTGRGIALEDLKGIRKRVTAKRKQRNMLANWGFFQLRSFIEYKALRVGVPVTLVDPSYTSQECPVCGHTERANRKTRDRFKCCSCGHTGPADFIAARNIRARAVVNQPMVASSCHVSCSAP